MSRTIWHFRFCNPIFVNITAIILSGAITPASFPQETPNLTTDPSQRRTLSPVTSVNQLSDIQPTDWAFQALQSLVERYGCLEGYRDRRFQGNRTLTRYEFAAGLNTCLNRVIESLNNTTVNFATRGDLALIQRLQEEFTAELATIGGQVLALESRTAELKANQVSTTTQLSGEVIFVIGDTFGDRASDNIVGGLNVDESDDPTQVYFGYRARLNFDTSLTGRDLLRTRLEAKEFPRLRDDRLNNSLMVRTSIDGDTDGFELNKLFYRFPIANGRAEVFIGVKGLDLDDAISPVRSSGSGAASRFGRYNPTSFRGPEGTGIGMRYAFSDQFQMNIAYLASDGDGPDARAGRGIFNSSYSALAHFLFEPSDRLSFGIEYNHRYFRNGDVNVTGGTGSFIANRPFGNRATTSENLGLQINWKVFDHFELGGWLGLTWAYQKRDGDLDATVFNWGVTLAFPDVIREGDLGGIVVGMPPKVVDHDIQDLEDRDTSIHLEAFYRFKINDHIGVIPGFFIVTNPNHNSKNETNWVGTFRTQFRF
ncbi:MAG: iron uptake porin [Cyanobacteriota bacterium]|nr:iron uptake porin [Cyanobacteriota bacterium]